MRKGQCAAFMMNSSAKMALETRTYGTNVTSQREMYLPKRITDFMLAQRPDGMLALFKLRNRVAGWSEEIYEILEGETAEIQKNLVAGEDLAAAVPHGGVLSLNAGSERVQIKNGRINLPEKFGLEKCLVLVQQTGNVLEIRRF